MLRLFFALLAGFLSAAPGAKAQTGLTALESGVDAEQWEAVGRLDLGVRGFCTGALIAEDLVLTAAHCLFDKSSGLRLDPSEITFLAGWRDGRAAAYRSVRRAVAHPGFRQGAHVSVDLVRNDLALLELARPIRNTTIVPFETGVRPQAGASVGVVSYAKDRSEAPSLQEVCDVLALQSGVLVTSCSVDFGASGAPIFVFTGGRARIVSVVSAKAELDGAAVALGTSLRAPLGVLREALSAEATPARPVRPVRPAGGTRHDTGARFIRSGQ